MGKIKFMMKAVIVLGCTLFVLSCATPASSFNYTRDGSYEPDTIFAEPKIKPSWTEKGLYQENGNIYVVGTAVSDQSFTIADKKAKDDAYGKLAEYSGAKVTKLSSSNTAVSSTRKEDKESDTFSESLEENITTYAEEELSQVRALETCKYIVEADDETKSSKFVSYSLMAIDKDIIDGVKARNTILSENLLQEVNNRIYEAESSDDIDFYLKIKDLVSRFAL